MLVCKRRNGQMYLICRQDSKPISSLNRISSFHARQPTVRQRIALLFPTLRTAPKPGLPLHFTRDWQYIDSRQEVAEFFKGLHVGETVHQCHEQPKFSSQNE